MKKLTGIKEAQLESLSKELDGLNFRFLGFFHIFNWFSSFLKILKIIKNPEFLKPLCNRGGGFIGRGQVQIKRCQRSRYNCLKASFALWRIFKLFIQFIQKEIYHDKSCRWSKSTEGSYKNHRLFKSFKHICNILKWIFTELLGPKCIDDLETVEQVKFKSNWIYSIFRLTSYGKLSWLNLENK